MTVTEMVAAVHEALQDESFTAARIITRLNVALSELVQLFPLPALMRSKNVTAAIGTNSVAMPSDYFTSLYRAYNNALEKDANIWFSHEAMRRVKGDITTGPVTDVSLTGNFTLSFYAKPEAAEIISLYYYTAPEELETGGDGPECLASHLHDVLVNWVVADIYGLIEDGMEGRKPNTQYWGARYQQAYQKVVHYYPAPNYPKYYWHRERGWV